MLETLSPLPSDPILGLIKRYQQDSNPQKIDLGVGVYKNEHGLTPILACVKKAEMLRLKTESTKVYIGPCGSESFNQLMTTLIFGKEHNAIFENRIRTVSTPGGTGALKVAADFIKKCHPNSTIWLSDPSWDNHQALFQSLKIKSYPYYDHQNKTLKFDEMCQQLMQVPSNDVVLFHACCHNPSGMDLTPKQWDKIIEISQQRNFIPLIDNAYQGFAVDLNHDAYGIRKFAECVPELIICSSCSKNFGLYRERIGACSIVAKTSKIADISLSILLYVIRCIYSMPPAHGAAIVENILASDELTSLWQNELAIMRNRINSNRQLLSAKFTHHGAQHRFDFIAKQTGMFSFLGITQHQVAILQQQYGIYMVDSSRISVAGITDQNVNYLAAAIMEILD